MTAERGAASLVTILVVIALVLAICWFVGIRFTVG